ncbi:MAG TPA: hypothetical protein VLA92_00735, partial [Candidatus Saccharimonadales bacterium]|nr:hypothetical protein [Candidatus Saccharimonadales bacterium]
MSEAVYGDTSPDFFDAARTPGETTHEDFYEAPDGQRHKVEIYIVGDEDPAPPIAQETEEERRYRAQQAFATHVAAVKQQGDPLDQLPNLRVRNSLLRASIPAVTAAELAAINPGLAITGGIIATAATVFGGRRANKKQSNAAYESLSATFGAQIGVGEYYELHRPTVSKKKIEAGLADDNLELYWYCPLKYDN